MAEHLASLEEKFFDASIYHQEWRKAMSNISQPDVMEEFRERLKHYRVAA